MAELNIRERQSGDVTVLDMDGRITIGEGSGFHFVRCFPFGAETVGDASQILDPVINQRHGDVFLVRASLGKENRLNTGHLPIVRGGFDSNVVGLGEGGEAGEAK